MFHVSASGAGTVKWQQVSEDLVPVNITCIQDSPECVFHITAYNSQVDKILDVRLLQPGEDFNYIFNFMCPFQYGYCWTCCVSIPQYDMSFDNLAYRVLSQNVPFSFNVFIAGTGICDRNTVFCTYFGVILNPRFQEWILEILPKGFQALYNIYYYHFCYTKLSS